MLSGRHFVPSRPLSLVLLSCFLAAAAVAVEAPAPPSREQLKSAVDVALAELRFRMAKDGSWGESLLDTALMVRALQESPRRYTVEDGPFVRDALAFLAHAMQADGSISSAGGRPLLDTAMAVAAFSGSTVAEHRALAERGRSYLAAELAADRRSASEKIAALPWILAALAPRAGEPDGLGPGRETALATLTKIDPPVRGPELAAAPVCGAGGTATLALDLLVLRFGPPGPRRDEATSRALALGATCFEAPAGALGPSLAAVETIAAALIDPRVVSALGGDRVASWKASLARQLLARQRFAGPWPAEGACEWGCSEVGGSALATIALSTLQR